MNTKELRLEQRKLWTKDKTLDPRCADLGIEVWTNETLVNNQKNYNLTIFRGSAGRPFLNVYYHERQHKQFLDRIDQEIEYARKERDDKAEKAKERGSNRYITASAACAKAIRSDLKVAFPGIKFKVNSENFAGGNTVNVRWEDGPNKNNVESLISKYEYGHFNAMEDRYEYSNTRNDIPQVKYLFTQREMSEEKRKKVESVLHRAFNGCI